MTPDDAVSADADPAWAREVLAAINIRTGRAYRLAEHRPPPHPMRPESGVWVVVDGDHRACIKRLPASTDLAGQRAAAATCERLAGLGSPVPRYHVVDVVAGDGVALMDFMPGHPVLLGTLTPNQARHLVELVELQAGAAVLPPCPPDTDAGRILEWADESAGPRSDEVLALVGRVQAITRELLDVRLPTGDIVHTDMNPSNFVVDRDGGDRITGIVDWENTITGDRAADLATSLFHLWGSPAANVLEEGLVARCTEAAFRLRLVALGFWALGWGRVTHAAEMLDRLTG